MAIEFCLGTASSITPVEGQRLLMDELDLRVAEAGPDWFFNSGVMLMRRDSFDEIALDVQEEISGFRPTWGIRMRPRVTISEDIYDLGFATMIRAVDCLLRHTQEDLFFSSEWERTIILRRNGRITVRTGYDYYIGERFLPLLTVPYTIEDIRP